MSASKPESVQVEERASPQPTSTGVVHDASEINQGNEAVLLRIEDGEKDGTGSLKLAKDGHVRLQASPVSN